MVFAPTTGNGANSLKIAPHIPDEPTSVRHQKCDYCLWIFAIIAISFLSLMSWGLMSDRDSPQRTMAEVMIGSIMLNAMCLFCVAIVERP